MDETLNPTVITAIADYDYESFVASTLFSQGWSVIHRALDLDSLKEFIQRTGRKDLLLIYSPDLPGLTAGEIAELREFIPRVIGVQSREVTPDFEELHIRPEGALELISLVRGNLRAPMVRNTRLESTAQKISYIHAFASVGPATGCTTIALNYAAEMSQLGKKTLLIDANAAAPAVSTYMDARNLTTEAGWKEIDDALFSVEVTRTNLESVVTRLDSAISVFDCIALDLGSLLDLQNSLTDRRWVSQMAIWASNHADETTFVSTPDILSATRLRSFVPTLAKISLRSRLSFALNQRSAGKRGAAEEAAFHATLAPLKAHSSFWLPRDVKALEVAKREQRTLIEASPRSSLRKALHLIARERIT